MYINEWYMPAVLLAWLFGYQGYASGQTLCLRRDTLDAIGGLRATADHLADDYRLCELIRALGLRTVLSPATVIRYHRYTYPNIAIADVLCGVKYISGERSGCPRCNCSGSGASSRNANAVSSANL